MLREAGIDPTQLPSLDPANAPDLSNLPDPTPEEVAEMEKRAHDALHNLSANATAHLPDEEEFGDFTKSVDEVARLIEGLKTGEVTPEQVDAIAAKKQQSKKVAPPATPAKTPEEEAAEKKAKDEKLERAKERVLEIQANLERKEAARKRYAAWVTKEKQREGDKKKATDYTAWDLWLPSDEEDEMVRNLQPAGAEFAAMEVSESGWLA